MQGGVCAVACHCQLPSFGANRGIVRSSCRYLHRASSCLAYVSGQSDMSSRSYKATNTVQASLSQGSSGSVSASCRSVRSNFHHSRCPSRSSALHSIATGPTNSASRGKSIAHRAPYFVLLAQDQLPRHIDLVRWSRCGISSCPHHPNLVIPFLLLVVINFGILPFATCSAAVATAISSFASAFSASVDATSIMVSARFTFLCIFDGCLCASQHPVWIDDPVHSFLVSLANQFQQVAFVH